MNKTVLIAGGASVASLAAGGAAGYLYAKRKFHAQIGGIVEAEVDKTKKYFSVLLAEARSGKPANPADVLTRTSEDDELPLEAEGDVADQEELTEADEKAIEKGRERLARASKALKDYAAFSKNVEGKTEVVVNNIFDNGDKKAKKTMPPRGPGGKFVSTRDAADKEQTPYLIDQNAFLINENEETQRNLLYFREEDTLLDLENGNEPVDAVLVGEVNLTLFPEPDEHGYSAIYVRNERLETDYEIRLMTESLTGFLNLDGDIPDFDEVDSAEHFTDQENEDLESDESSYQEV